MKTGVILGAVAAASLAGLASAQSAVYSWSVAYGTLTTAPTATAAGVFTAIPAATAIGDAGATHARVRLSLNLQGITMNNINTGTAGTQIGAGQASGLFYTAFDLVANSASNNGGSFSPGWIRNGGLRPTSNSGILPPQPGSVNGIGAVQLAQQPGLSQPGNQATSFADFWEVFWTRPANVTQTFTWNPAVPAFANGNATQIITNEDPDPLNNFTGGFATIPTSYNGPLSINVLVPAPGALALMGLGGLAAARRRRA